MNVNQSTVATKDPVCGMTVDPAKAKASVRHGDATYYFCCSSCAQKFLGSPDDYLKPKLAGLVTLGAAPATKTLPPSVAIAPKSKPATRPFAASAPAYVCPMCPEVRAIAAG